MINIAKASQMQISAAEQAGPRALSASRIPSADTLPVPTRPRRPLDVLWKDVIERAGSLAFAIAFQSSISSAASPLGAINSGANLLALLQLAAVRISLHQIEPR
jgi:hypothetical protein